jgi:hypothetical protein
MSQYASLFLSSVVVVFLSLAPLAPLRSGKEKRLERS